MTITATPIMAPPVKKAPGNGAILADTTIGVLAGQLDDIESLRKSTSNRLSALTRSEVDKDGVSRGAAMDDEEPAVLVTQALLDSLNAIEKTVIKALQQEVKKHPLYPFVASRKGLGEKQFGRLLAAIGDPYWMQRFEKIESVHVLIEERPRSVSELWSYTGMSVVDGSAPKRKKGVISNWKNEARMRLWNIAESLLKANSPEYRKFYDDARVKYENAVYEDGRPLTDAHKHKRAMRAMSKALLKDLWIESKRLHEEYAEAN